MGIMREKTKRVTAQMGPSARRVGDHGEPRGRDCSTSPVGQARGEEHICRRASRRDCSRLPVRRLPKLGFRFFPLKNKSPAPTQTPAGNVATFRMGRSSGPGGRSLPTLLLPFRIRFAPHIRHVQEFNRLAFGFLAAPVIARGRRHAGMARQPLHSADVGPGVE